MNKVLLASYVVRSGAKTVMSINFVYLDECLRLLQNNKKSVMEDDTCFARIGTSIELLIGQDVHSGQLLLLLRKECFNVKKTVN